MNLDLDLIWPPLLAGLLVCATHVPLGQQVLRRGIVFIDLAVAQIAGLGVVFADWLGFEPRGAAVQIAALAAALAGALMLNWTDRRWPEVQEAVIGASFVVAANVAILLLAASPHGAEHLKDLLIGQVLWVGAGQLPWVALASAALLALWFIARERMGALGFYLLFACAVTLSVQLVGLYLVFSTLIVPALAARRFGAGGLLAGYAVAALGYLAGLSLSLDVDLPPGPLVVLAMVGFALASAAVPARRARVQ